MKFLKFCDEVIKNHIINENISTNGLFIIRGLPGSGKSTMAKNIMKYVEKCEHYEADMFFEKDGKYNYDRTKIGEAHAWCQNETKKALLNGKNVIVSNTFTTLKEMEPYISFCKKHSIRFEVYRMTKNFGNIHNVPEDVIEKMNKRFEDYPNERLR